MYWTFAVVESMLHLHKAFTSLLSRILRYNPSNPVRHLLRHRNAMPNAESMRPPLSLINFHNWFPVFTHTFHFLHTTRTESTTVVYQRIPRRIRNPMIFASKQEAQKWSRVRMCSCWLSGRCTPHFLVPNVGVNLEHFIARHVERLLNSMR